MSLSIEEKIDQLHGMIRKVNQRVFQLMYVQTPTTANFDEWLQTWYKKGSIEYKRAFEMEWEEK